MAQQPHAAEDGDFEAVELDAGLPEGRPTESSDDEEEADEEQEQEAASGAVARAEAGALDELMNKGTLGIRAAKELGSDEDDSDRLPSAAGQEVNLEVPGEFWFQMAFSPHHSVAHLLQSRDVLQRLIQKCGCHIKVDLEQGRLHVMASSAAAAASARAVFSRPLEDVEEEVLAAAEAGDVAQPEDEESEDEGHEEVETAWEYMEQGRSSCHYVVWPSFSKSPDRSRAYRPRKGTLSFKYRLDPAQARAMACVEYKEAVLMCAPTSAGKTAVAEFALALALQGNKRGIYTTPIKALSNQKFMELGNRLGVERLGLMTGDTNIASDAPVVVMTLEILLIKLYKQTMVPGLLDDFQCVVIDEAHFLGHSDRGYAWEEVLILLPPHITVVLLSATIPNHFDIAEWIARVRVGPVHVLYSETRPVPLVHEIFRCGPPEFEGKKRSFFRLRGPRDEQGIKEGNLEEAVYQRAEIIAARPRWRVPRDLIGAFIGRNGANVKELAAGKARIIVHTETRDIQVQASQPADAKEVKDNIAWWLYDRGVPWDEALPTNNEDPDSMQAEDLERLLSMLTLRKQLPCICFCFDKRVCERMAIVLAGLKCLDFAPQKAKKEEIQKRLNWGLDRLEAKDRDLEQVESCQKLLLRGMGVHHAGMLPLLRELVELLFSDGLLQVMFATETFSMGLNMPAKAVVFTDLVKFDGKERRVVTPGEFQQMAGRAGRRGKDPEGHVYIMLNSIELTFGQGKDLQSRPTDEVIRELYMEEPPHVMSAYRIRWTSLVTMLATGQAHIFSILDRSLLASSLPAKANEMRDQVGRMLAVLRELDFVDRTGTLLPKGAMVCRLRVPEDALLLAEVIVALDGFKGLSAAQIFAVCVGFVAPACRKQEYVPGQEQAVKDALRVVRETAQCVAGKLHKQNLLCCSECRGSWCNGEPLAFQHVNPQLSMAILRWARGEDFTATVQRSGVLLGGEGALVRTFKRLDRLMQEVTFVLRHFLGATTMATALQETRLATRRGILAVQSAYLGEAEDGAAEELEPDAPWPSPPLKHGEVGELDPLEIGFCQNTVCANFRRGTQSVLELANQLLDGSCQVHQIPRLEVYWFRHRFYSLGNRRLAAYRLWRLAAGEEVKVPVQAVSRQRALELHWMNKFTTGFTGGQRIRIRGTDQHIGVTKEQSSYGRAIWGAPAPLVPGLLTRRQS